MEFQNCFQKKVDIDVDDTEKVCTFAVPKKWVNVNINYMYAIVDIAGQQFKVEKNKAIFVHRLDSEEGSAIEFNKVLLIDNDGQINIGVPIIEGAAISAKVISHVKGDKVRVFKKKRRKGYQKLSGHRQQFSQIMVEDIRF